MADLREVFPILVDEVSDEGRAVTASVAGDSAASKVGVTAFAFKNHNGNLVLPTLTPEGKVPVDFQGAGVSLSATSNGSVAGSLTNVTICEISLGNSRTYGRILATGSCFREAIFEVVWQNGTTNTIIGAFLVGPGQYTFTWSGGELEVLSGSTGTQKFILRARNLQKESDFRGNIAALEFAS